jgi:putative SOS response-associated peptidase YedK
VVRYDVRASERTLDVMRWGLVPFWAKDIKVGFANINAKAEGIESKPAFRQAFQRRRCLVPVDNFYEWKKTATGKQPYAIALADRRLMVLTGLWETWRSPAGERVRSFAIVTTAPNELCAELHNRMPVVLKPAAWPAWLGEEPADAPQLKALLAPYPSEEMVAWPVSPRVGNVKNNDPSLIEPIVGTDRCAGSVPGGSDELAQMARRAPRYAGAGCVRPRGPGPLRAGEYARQGR